MQMEHHARLMSASGTGSRKASAIIRALCIKLLSPVRHRKTAQITIGTEGATDTISHQLLSYATARRGIPAVSAGRKMLNTVPL